MKYEISATRKRYAAHATVLAGFLAALVILPAEIRTSALPALPNSPAADAHQYTGAGSCSSSSCHGGIAARTDSRINQNEYSIWIVRDKHSKAYSALTGVLGERMAATLDVGKAESAHKCLACHALDAPVSEHAHTFDLSDGVSCESCHGPASAWLGPHTERNWTHQQSVQAGMIDTRDIVHRTEQCLSCHLGNQEKYVDHEMIAAGHPDLYFELASFSDTMPRHWNEPRQLGEAATASVSNAASNNDPWYEVREWSAGQAVQLRQSLVRLAERTRGKNWPEYSEMECYACHHSLVPADQSWRQLRGYPDRRAGDPPWNASRYVVFREIVHQVDDAAGQKLDSQIAQLSKLMSQANPPREDVASVASSAAQTAGELAQKLNTMRYDSGVTMRVLQQISSHAETISNQDEHAAAQAAMALQSLFVAYDRNQHTPNAPEVRAAISSLFDQLQAPSSYDSNRFARQMRQVNALLH